MLAVCMTLIDDAESQTEFNDIVMQYEKKLYGYAYSILHNTALAEEAVWETFFAIAKCFERIKDGGVENIEAYLVITLRNSCYKIYNNEKKHYDSLSLETVNENEISSFDEFNKYEISDLCDVLKELNDTYQSVIAYMLYYEYSADDTAKLMGISRSTVYKYLNDAKKTLRNKLGAANG